MILIERTMRTDALRQVEQLGKLLFEGEENAHEFLISPAEGISFSGYEVTARFVRADGQNVAPGGTVTDGKASVVLTPACYAVPGGFSLYIYVVGESETVCVYACAGQVIATVGANGAAGDVPDPIIEFYTEPEIEALKNLTGVLVECYAAAHSGVTTSPLTQLSSVEVTGSSLTAEFDPTVYSNSLTNVRGATGEQYLALAAVPRVPGAELAYSYDVLAGPLVTVNEVGEDGNAWTIQLGGSYARVKFTITVTMAGLSSSYTFSINYYTSA